jgi:hydroxyethylthiazole kinase-like uncharacterized protein yjeF
MENFYKHICEMSQIRTLEALALKENGLTVAILMEKAGQAAYVYLKKKWPMCQRLLVLCGSGNNGGDAYVLARIAVEAGLSVKILQINHAIPHKPEAVEAYQACKKAKLSIETYKAEMVLPAADVIIDAVYGIGLPGVMSADAKAVIKAINGSASPILAIDVPSGLNANTGAVLEQAVKAAATLTFIGLKLGFFAGCGMDYTGELVCDNLGLPAELYKDNLNLVELLNDNYRDNFLKARARDFHKGDAGHVLIVGGDEGYAGAVRMAAEAALRVGAGLVTVATHPAHAAIINVHYPEIICYGIHKAKALKPLILRAKVLILGPGLGQSSWSKSIFKQVIHCEQPLLVDADGLNLLAKHNFIRDNWVLTPHPGEGARLLKSSVASLQQNRLEAVKEISKRFNCVAVLKGSGSLITAPLEKTFLCQKGNPGMATAGMGDVLSGVIGALIAQGLPVFEAAKIGVFIHALAGDRAAVAGQRGTVATDLLPHLRQLVNP